MKSITDIYAEYNLMPNLQLHQLRVAAVASLICEKCSVPIDKEGVITACLLHDMGNIIKFDLTYFPEFVEPEGLAYWQKIKDEYIHKYGPSEHHATQEIAKELGVSEKILKYMDKVGFTHLDVTAQQQVLEKKICAYADMRVTPHGVSSIEQRMQDGLKRYQYRKDKSLAIEKHTLFSNALREVEQQIYTVVEGKPEDITDEAVQTRIDELRNYTI